MLVHLRGLKRQRWVTLDEDVAALVAEELEEQADPDPTEWKIEALRTCLEKLRPGDRELIMQRYWRKEPLHAFAARRGRSLNGLKVQLFRLRAALKRCVEDRISRRCLP